MLLPSDVSIEAVLQDPYFPCIKFNEGVTLLAPLALNHGSANNLYIC